MRILLIEGDSATAQSMELMLRSEGHSVRTTDSGDEGLQLASSYEYDMILLEIALKDMSGYQVVRTLRVSKITTPIFIVSGLAGIQDRVMGLGFGADDYLTKPFHKDELLARIYAITRRARGLAHSVVEVGTMTVDLARRKVLVKGSDIRLTPKEFGVMEIFASRVESRVSKEIILEHIYGDGARAEIKIVDVFVCKIRKKIADYDDENQYIETVWGQGYVLHDPLRQAESA